MSLTSLLVRTMFTKGDTARDKGLTSPADVERFDNILYGTDTKWQVLDVYRPIAKAGEALPVIVSVHGGGWVYGHKDVYQFYCMSLAQKGFAVVNYSYRLAPECKYPSSLEDTNSVFTWILNNAEKYGFDTKHIFAVGDSAGAHNLGLFSAICTNPEYAKNYDFKAPEGFAPTAVALNCGAYKIDMDGKNSLTKSLMKDFLPNKGSAKEVELIDVTKHVTSKFPPAYVMTSNGDFLLNQAPLMTEKLAACGVKHEYKCYGDDTNKLMHVFHCNIKSDDANKCNEDEIEFFKKFL